MRGIVKNSGQEQFGRFERLSRSAISQLGVGEQIGRHGESAVGRLGDFSQIPL